MRETHQSPPPNLGGGLQQSSFSSAKFGGIIPFHLRNYSSKTLASETPINRWLHTRVKGERGNEGARGINQSNILVGRNYYPNALLYAETRYSKLEKLILAIVVSMRKLQPYYQAHRVIVMTDFPSKSILYSPDASQRLMKWAIDLNQYDLLY
ncbi:unnamed protein product [Prunus armeniaca]